MDLLATLETFAEQCNQNQRLRKMNRDWTRLVELWATDTDQRYWLKSEAGWITSGSGEAMDAELKISARHDILHDIFSGVITPTEPYNAGDLLVKGRQDDMMRLDIITLLIWGE
ncbi:MAG: sterol carrier protein [Firmicutes bacterium]|nr:sterol carrier protein [Bacillota bacterium]MCL5972678.1 sterol carrier protein [Bacillota bacterium]